MQEFFKKNKVFITGLIGAVILAIAQADVTNGATLSVFIMPVIIALSAYFANNLRGQLASVAGIGFSILISYFTARQAGEAFSLDAKTLQTIVLQIAVLYFGYNAPPFKVNGYEKSTLIQEAKQEGQAIQEQTKTDPPPQL